MININYLEKIAKRRLIIQNGKIMDQEAYDELKNSGIYLKNGKREKIAYEKVADNVLTRPTKQALKSIPKFLWYGTDRALAEPLDVYGPGLGMAVRNLANKTKIHKLNRLGNLIETVGWQTREMGPVSNYLQIRDLTNSLNPNNYKLKKFIKKRNPAMYSDSESLAQTIYKGPPVKSILKDNKDFKVSHDRFRYHSAHNARDFSKVPVNPEMAKEVDALFAKHNMNNNWFDEYLNWIKK